MRFLSSELWKGSRFPVVVICILSIALGFSLAVSYYRPVTAAPAPASGITNDWRTAFEQVAEKVGPSVVKITTETKVKSQSLIPNMDDFFAPFGMPDRPRQQPQPRLVEATGSGFIVRPDGYILTNNHVVKDADRVTVQLPDGREFKGKVMLDPITDLALVKIDATGLPALTMGDSDKVKVGQWATAVGNPFGLKNTVTVGVISAIRKEVGEAPIASPVIQTDASINPGNSGGPLVDLNGSVIGINFMIISQSGGNQGVGFSIPSNTARFVMEQLIKRGKVVRGYLGIDLGDLTPTLSDALGAKKGALVQNVYKDSPAEKSGMKVKDVITKVDGKSISDAADLRSAVQETPPDTTVSMVIVRDKKEKTVSVKLGTLKENEETAEGGGSAEDKIGMSVQPLTSDLAKELGVPEDIKGVVVRSVQAGTPAARAGVRPKDVITEIDDQAITSVASFSKATKKLKSGETAIVVIQRGERSQIVEMTVD
jgi:serine protease Do